MVKAADTDTAHDAAGSFIGRWAGQGVLAAVALDLALVGGAVARYPALLAQPGAATYVLEPIAILCCYAFASVMLQEIAPRSACRLALRRGTLVGLLTGTLWIVNLALETFSDLGDRMGPFASAPFFLGVFALWGVAGFIAVWPTGSIPLGVLAAVWAAMVCVLITITFGLLLTYTSLLRLEDAIAADPDFLRSRWQDLHAFAIANSFNAAFSHLLIAPLIGASVGAIGGCTGAGWRRLSDTGQTVAG